MFDRLKAHIERVKKQRELAKKRYSEQSKKNREEEPEPEDETEGDSEINECEEESEIPEEFLE